MSNWAPRQKAIANAIMFYLVGGPAGLLVLPRFVGSKIGGEPTIEEIEEVLYLLTAIKMVEINWLKEDPPAKRRDRRQRRLDLIEATRRGAKIAKKRAKS